jgi:hypothetical protein
MAMAWRQYNGYSDGNGDIVAMVTGDRCESGAVTVTNSRDSDSCGIGDNDDNVIAVMITVTVGNSDSNCCGIDDSSGNMAVTAVRDSNW